MQLYPRSEKFKIRITYVKFEKNMAIKKVNQSVKSDTLTVTFLIYEATRDTTRQHNELVPRGSPVTTSFITPAKKIFPFPITDGFLSIQ